MLEKQSASNLGEIQFNFSDYQKTNRFLQAIDYKKPYISKDSAKHLFSAKRDKAIVLKSGLYLLGALSLIPLSVNLFHAGKSAIVLENDILGILMLTLSCYGIYQAIKLLKHYQKRKTVRKSLI